MKRLLITLLLMITCAYAYAGDVGRYQLISGVIETTPGAPRGTGTT